MEYHFYDAFLKLHLMILVRYQSVPLKKKPVWILFLVSFYEIPASVGMTVP